MAIYISKFTPYDNKYKRSQGHAEFISASLSYEDGILKHPPDPARTTCRAGGRAGVQDDAYSVRLDFRLDNKR